MYLNGADPKLITRTWQEVMENLLAKKTGSTLRRWETAIKDRNFDCLRNLCAVLADHPCVGPKELRNLRLVVRQVLVERRARGHPCFSSALVSSQPRIHRR